jgi:hypothetical protein
MSGHWTYKKTVVMNPKPVTFWRPVYDTFRLSTSSFSLCDTVAPLSEIVTMFRDRRGITLTTATQQYRFSTREKETDVLLCKAVEYLKGGHLLPARRALIKTDISKYIFAVFCVVALALSWHTAGWGGKLPSFWQLWEFGRLWLAGGIAVYWIIYRWLKWKYTFAPNQNLDGIVANRTEPSS